MSARSARGPAPPAGEPPPGRVALPDGTELDLAELAREICRRYRGEFPDERQRYGAAGVDWCVHDNQHLINWAALSLRGFLDFEQKLAWLARVLEARDFPVERLMRDLEICAEITEARLGHRGTGLALTLRSGAELFLVP